MAADSCSLHNISIETNLRNCQCSGFRVVKVIVFAVAMKSIVASVMIKALAVLVLSVPSLSVGLYPAKSNASPYLQSSFQVECILGASYC